MSVPGVSHNMGRNAAKRARKIGARKYWRKPQAVA
jgi:hypothetical protein